MRAIGSIYLAWRKGKGSPRTVVGLIKRNVTEGVRFSYIEKGVIEAQKQGFTPYVGFPDTTKTYTENVLDIFGQRLIRTERSDKQKYLDYWAIDPKYQDNRYYLLAYTQGLLSTDNFEFLADFYPVKDLRFISEICGLSHSEVKPGILKEGDLLKWVYEENNPRDKFAVMAYKEDKFIGYIKTIHSRVFNKKPSMPLKIKVKSLDQNGSVNRIFVEIYF